VTLSDLAKYSMTLSVERTLCDSWASCCIKEETESLVSSKYNHVYNSYWDDKNKSTIILVLTIV